MFGSSSEYAEELRAMRTQLHELDNRVASLEARMTEAENDIKEAAHCAREAAENSATIISIMEGAKGVAGFVAKHGPRFVAFGVGLMAAAGMGNPEVLAFLQAFFGN